MLVPRRCSDNVYFSQNNARLVDCSECTDSMKFHFKLALCDTSIYFKGQLVMA